MFTGEFCFFSNPSETLVSTFSVIPDDMQSQSHKTGAVRKDVLPSLETVWVITALGTVDCELPF